MQTQPTETTTTTPYADELLRRARLWKPKGVQMRMSRANALREGRRLRQIDRRYADIVAAVMDLSTDTITQVTPVVAFMVTRRIGGYNRLSVPGFARLLRRIDAICGRKRYDPTPDGFDNANDGMYAYKLHIGNEGSQVLYVDNYGFEWDAEARRYRHVPFDALQLRALALAAREAHADEYGPTDEARPWQFRIWWD